jgi:Fur family ferric uptake transcriptional regulator
MLVRLHAIFSTLPTLKIDSSSAQTLKWLIAKSGRKAVTMSHHTIAYEDIIRAAGHRVTPQRIRILDAICDGGGHTTLGEVYARVRQVDRSIDRSTLYRTLKLFVELGLVVSADTGDGETYYEIAKPHRHHHLVCRQCGQQQEIDHAAVEPVFKHLLDRYGFQADTDHLVLFGICANCQASGSATG